MQEIDPALVEALRKVFTPPKPKWCGQCGARHVHRDGCNFKPTSYGTFARADLIPHLEARHRELLGRA